MSLNIGNEKISLANLGGGAAVEKFDVELQKVLDNISDPNTIINAVRKVTLTVSLKPKKRTYANLEIACHATLAKDLSYETNAYIGADIHGKAEAYEHNPEQMELDFEQHQEEQRAAAQSEADESAGNVTNISKAQR